MHSSCEFKRLQTVVCNNVLSYWHYTYSYIHVVIDSLQVSTEVIAALEWLAEVLLDIHEL